MGKRAQMGWHQGKKAEWNEEAGQKQRLQGEQQTVWQGPRG